MRHNQCLINKRIKIKILQVLLILSFYRKILMKSEEKHRNNSNLKEVFKALFTINELIKSTETHKRIIKILVELL